MQSDILLLLTWNDNHSKGILTGKFFEYLLFKKPILGIVSGNVPNSETYELINRLKVGFCYEQASGLDSERKLKDYILSLYTSFTISKEIDFQPNIEDVNNFDYEKLAFNLNDIIIEVTKNREI